MKQTEDTGLVKIGKLGNYIEDGKRFVFNITTNFQENYLSMGELFLIMDDSKIRFTMFDNLGMKGVKKFVCGFPDSEIRKEIINSHNSWLAVDSKMMSELESDDDSLLGMSIEFNNIVIGTVIGLFNNSVYNIIVAEINTLSDSEEELIKEVMIPDVDEFIIDKNYEDKRIKVKNIEGLLAL